MERIILASKSPRRRELMKMIGVEFEVTDPNIDETFDKSKTIEENVENIAYQKAEKIFKKNSDAIVIGVDTIVSVEDLPFGKPESEAEAAAMLQVMAGTTHKVISSISILSSGMSFARTLTTEVTFKELSKKEVADYVNTGEPMDKAGAYAIQGGAALFVREIKGDYYNVVGLSVNTVYEALTQYFLNK